MLMHILNCVLKRPVNHETLHTVRSWLRDRAVFLKEIEKYKVSSEFAVRVP